MGGINLSVLYNQVEVLLQAMSLIRTGLSEIPVILVLTKSFFETVRNILQFSVQKCLVHRMVQKSFN
jgi:hypothetical protein